MDAAPRFRARFEAHYPVYGRDVDMSRPPPPA
jgi:hypothetical protein